ncbi:MAG: LapA family protein [Chthoniobacterales bacterium]
MKIICLCDRTEAETGTHRYGYAGDVIRSKGCYGTPRLQFFRLARSLQVIDHNPMRNLKIIAASVLAILVAILVIQNTEPVETHLLNTTVAMPHAVLIFISAAAGFALGVLLTMSLKSKRKNIR